MSCGLTGTAKILSSLNLIRFTGLIFLLAVVFPLNGLAQVVGPGGEDVKNQPGYSAPPTEPLRPMPKGSTDPQVKAVVEQIAAADLLHPETLEQVRWTHSHSRLHPAFWRSASDMGLLPWWRICRGQH